MTKEKYEKPFMEIIELKNDIIMGSGNGMCGGYGECSPVGVCEDDCIAHCSYCPGDGH